MKSDKPLAGNLPTPMELLALFGCILASVGIIYRAAAILTAPLTEKLEFLTDDGFYYLVLARNFDNLGRWTFDGGVSLTSGFHPLFGYLLVVLHKLFPGTDPFLQAAVSLEFGLLLMIILSVWWIARKERALVLLLCFSLVIVCDFCFFASQSMLEWQLSVLSAIVLAYLIWRKSRFHGWVFFIVGFLGEIGRSDWGLWPFSLLAAAVVVSLVRKDKTVLLSASWAALGVVAGAGFVFVHSALTTGQVVQGSAMMKVHWTKGRGVSIFPVLVLIGSILPGSCRNGLVQLITLPALALAFACGLYFRIQNVCTVKMRNVCRDNPQDVVLVLGSVIALVGYCGAYTISSGGIALWYTQNLIVPITVLYYFALEAVFRRNKVFALGLNALALTVITYQSAAFVLSERGLYTWDPVTLQAAYFIRDNLAGHRIGSFNSGIPGYFAGERATIINLDGLVNNDIYQFAKDGKTYDYLADRKIEYVADWPLWIRKMAPLCGFSSEKLERSLKPVKTFADEKSDEVFNAYTISRFEPVP